MTGMALHLESYRRLARAVCLCALPAVAAGEFAVESLVTNAACDFSAPTNAIVCEKWTSRGASQDWFSITNDLTWAFPFGTSAVRRITVSSAGEVHLHANSKPDTGANERMLRVAFEPGRDVAEDCAMLAPLRARMGMLPRHNWNEAGGLESCCW